MRKTHAGLAAVLALTLGGACARNPVSGRPEVTLVSEAKERELGEAEARRVAETMGILEDPALSAYVRAVGERLAQFSPRTDVTYTFQIVDMEEPNAFALPGGPVYVSRGLLVLTNSEDELAGALARTAAAPVAGPGGMLRRLDGLPVGPRASNGVFDGETFLHPDLDFRVRFPAGWKTANERTVVGASAPDGRAVVGLGLVGKGSDPEAALRAFQEEAEIDLAPGAERLMVGGLPAIHATTTARTRDGRVALDLTWIAHAERIYRVIGATPPDGAAAAKPFFRATVESFRPLTASERAGIRETRVRIVAARAGEGLADVLARARSTWTVETAAVANGLDATARLRSAKLVKGAVAEPYTHEQ